MPVNYEPFELLRTKLHRPRLARDLVERPRVRDTFDRYAATPLTLVCAPAGFGKTTALSDWLSRCACQNAWLSLDAGDSDLGVFLTYFIAAIRTVFPRACEQTAMLVSAPRLPPLEVLSLSLANEIDQLADQPSLAGGRRFVLVLDDYHHIGGQAAHALINNLLRHPPRSLHLVISTRQDPPIALHLLRAHGEMGELRSLDLRFTREEVRAFMETSARAALEPEALDTLVERTEGWVTGLRLAAMTQSAAGREWPAARPPADNRYTSDYLVNEVLAHTPAQTQEFLVKTSILDRLCGSLCDAVSPPVDPAWDGRAYLEWLAAASMFTFAVDPQDVWYRYHQIFQSLLRSRLERDYSAEEIAELHAGASAWFWEHGLVEEALDHALAAHLEDMATRIVESERHKCMAREDWRQLERWLGLFPAAIIARRPELTVAECWLLQKQWKYNDIAASLERAEALLEQSPLPQIDKMRLFSEVHALRALTAFYRGDATATRENAEKAVATVPLECSFVRSIAWLYWGAARLMNGDPQGALDAYRDAMREDRLHADAFISRLYFGTCVVYWMAGDLPNLMRSAKQFLQAGLERNLREAVCWGHYFRGCAFYHVNDLAQAEQEFGEVVRQEHFAHDGAFAQCMFGLASIYLARGESARAKQAAEEIAAFGLRKGNSRITTDAEVFLAYVLLRSGARAEAQAWANAQPVDRFSVPMTNFHVSRLKLAAILVSAPNSWERAAGVLAEARVLCEDSRNLRFLMETLALEALLADAQGDQEAALDKLSQALTLAEPSHIIRVFLDLGPKMGTLLKELAARRASSDYVSDLLAAFEGEQGAESEPDPDQPAKSLTERELDVLSLLANRLSNKEIALKLCIRPMTAKRHTVNIYRKLEVTSRREAVAKAIELGLIDAAEAARPRLP